MAHEVRAKIDTKVVAHKDLEIVVKTSSDGKLGTLLISKGNVEWLPKGNWVNRRRLSWRKLATLMETEGRRVKKRRVAV
jgi:curli biogenesis system outer membrane secretion channel CsgG